MIWNEELAASLDQSSGVVVFHRIDATRAQQLAQSLADKLGALIEQNEKGLDLKLGGGSGWGDRADGTKQEKRGGDQAGERRRTGERRGGTASRGAFLHLPTTRHADIPDGQEAHAGGEVHDFRKAWAIAWVKRHKGQGRRLEVVRLPSVFWICYHNHFLIKSNRPVQTLECGNNIPS